MKFRIFLAVIVLAGILTSCLPNTQNQAGLGSTKPIIVVTYPVLGAMVQELAGSAFQVVIPMPNGLDPHEWEPSAKDVQVMSSAVLIVQNGLGLEGGMERALARMQEAGVAVFTASEHIKIRRVKPGEGLPSGDADQAVGANDPHLWLDPQAMKAIMVALSQEIKSRFSIDLQVSCQALTTRIDALDQELQAKVAGIAPKDRLLVTGHESMGYFAEHFGFTLVGAIIPSLNTQASVSARDMENLKRAIAGRQVRVIFTEIGTPAKVSEALAAETGIRTVSIATHVLGSDGSWFSLMRNLTQNICDALAEP